MFSNFLQILGLPPSKFFSITRIIFSHNRSEQFWQQNTIYSILAQCNGIQDCFGGDDEQFCLTFNCNNGTALAYSQKCDGFPDCPDGEDEDDCLGMYFVAKGQLILKAKYQVRPYFNQPTKFFTFFCPSL